MKLTVCPGQTLLIDGVITIEGGNVVPIIIFNELETTIGGVAQVAVEVNKHTIESLFASVVLV